MTSQTRQGSGHDWDDARKAALFADIVSLKLSIDEAAALHGLRVDVIQEWLRLFRRSALVAFDERLKKTLIDQGANADALTAAEFTGHVEDVSIADLVQTIEIAGKDAVITVTHEGTDSRMWCSAGAIIDAESGRLSGEAAVYRILSFERGRMVADLRPEQRARTIYAATHRLLIEAIRRKDESAQLERKLGNVNRLYRLGERSTSSRVRVSTDELSILRLFDGPRRLREVLAQSHIGDLETLTALMRLVEDGYLVENDAAPQPPRLASDVRTQRGAAPVMLQTERLEPSRRREMMADSERKESARRSEAPTRPDASLRPEATARTVTARPLEGALAHGEVAVRKEAPSRAPPRPARRSQAPAQATSPGREAIPGHEHPTPARGEASVRDEASVRGEASLRGEAPVGGEAPVDGDAPARGEATARSEASTLPPLSKRVPVAAVGEAPKAAEPASEDARRSEPIEGADAAPSFVPLTLSERPRRLASRWLLVGLAAALLTPAAFWVGETLSNLRAGRRPHAAADGVESRTAALDVAPTFSLSTRVEPATAEMWLDRHPVATGELAIVLPKDGSTHELRVAAPGHIPVTLLFADVPPPKLIRLEALPGAGAPSEGSGALSAAEPARAARAVGAASSAAPAIDAAPSNGARRDADGLGEGGADEATPREAGAAPAPAKVPTRATRAATRVSAAARKRRASAASLGADTTPSAAARVIAPAPPPSPHVQIIDESAPKVRVIE